VKVVLATRNKGKIREIVPILSSQLKIPVEILSLLDYPHIPEIKEDGRTLEENAIKKATTVASLTGLITIADDSGLEVDALDGLPGVHSARFAGEEADDKKNMEKLLHLLEGIPLERRTARFRCVIAIAHPSGEIHTVDGTCDGIITTEKRGERGFGYDPVFLIPSYGKTFAELGEEIKNRISHRAIALKKASTLLNSLLKKWESSKE